ncbi:PHA/PHB synthase family protein [Achromobacter anxifer]|nr:alpha/beta fold hydrolase [Achromobacter anxifer]
MHSVADRRMEEDPFQALNYWKEALIAQATGGSSPAALTLALADWWIHLCTAPGKQLELGVKYGEAIAALYQHAAQPWSRPQRDASVPPGNDGQAQPAWQQEPFSLWWHAFLTARHWWIDATSQVPGVAPHHADLVSFCASQWCDTLSPANFPWSNPVVQERCLAEGGRNLSAGLLNLFNDIRRQLVQAPEEGMERFQVGKTVAVTPGAVVFRNHLIELIQYAPASATVRPEPILITPAWIMKYYILDLSPENSLIRYLVAQGYTVFCISWRNVGSADRNLSLDDYRRLGFMAALDAVSRIVPGRRVHAVGYCLGGTLLSIAAAAMAGQKDTRLATLTLLAAQTDFTEPGGLGLYIDASEVYFLESLMWAQGYLSAAQMSAAFQSLRPVSDTAARAVRRYLLGEHAAPNDLMAWNADSTRMPYRMHAEYLRKLFLNNELAAGRYQVDGRMIALRNIRVPIYALGAESDRIAPWRSVYKIHYQTDADIRFVLASGGHNAGIVSEPGHPGRWHRAGASAPDGLRVGADEWMAGSSLHAGSWWPDWQAWLDAHSGPPLPALRSLGEAGADRTALTPAPGRFVLQD